MADSNKRSAARAKPKREAAGSIRYGASSSVGNDNKSRKAYATERLSKKAERQKRSRDEDRIYVVADILLEDDAEYQKMRNVWKWLMGLAVAMIVATIACGQISGHMEEGTLKTVLSIATTVTLVLGYAFIIAVFVYDMVKMRPKRAEYDQRVRSMTEKKQQQIVTEHEEAEAAKRKAKRDAKNAKA